jgi:CHAD domain-containing protein
MPHNGKPDGIAAVDHDRPGRTERIAEEPPRCAARAIRESLARGVERLRQSDPGVREGTPRGVHAMRTSTRRLRSTLRTFRTLVESDWAGPLEEELKWLGGLLGAVRDLDVLQERLRDAAGKSVEDLGPLFRTLGDRHLEATRALQAGLVSERYRALLDRLAEASAGPAVRDGALEPCPKALPPLVAAAWKSLRKRGRALGERDPDEDFHETRKRAKRARYAAEAVAAALKPKRARDAKRFARLATRVQDVLGEHQDATVAGQELARIAALHGGDAPFCRAVARLMKRQSRAADRSRRRFFKVWDRLDRKKHRRWFER